jgi:hypothetical protein
LPYYYFCKNEFFDNAIIIHDSVFIQQRINFEKLIDTKIKVLPLWHFSFEKKENYNNTTRLISSLSNNYLIMNVLFQNREYDVLGKFNNDIWRGCFGVQSFINREFLIVLENKYKLSNLLTLVKTRLDRCCLERIFGSIFFTEYQKIIDKKSLLGDIMKYQKWGYSYNDYKADLKKGTVPRAIVKVWTGR